MCSFIATFPVSLISYLVDRQQSNHWISEAGLLLKIIVKLAHVFRRKDTHLICDKHVFVLKPYKLPQIHRREMICFSKYSGGFNL